MSGWLRLWRGMMIGSRFASVLKLILLLIKEVSDIIYSLHSEWKMRIKSYKRRNH